MKLNVQICPYWLWLISAFGLIAILPCVPTKSGLVVLGALYVNTHFWHWFLIIHTSLSVAAAILITILLARAKILGCAMPKSPLSGMSPITISLYAIAPGILISGLIYARASSSQSSCALLSYAVVIVGRITCSAALRRIARGSQDCDGKDE